MNEVSLISIVCLFCATGRNLMRVDLRVEIRKAGLLDTRNVQHKICVNVSFQKVWWENNIIWLKSHSYDWWEKITDFDKIVVFWVWRRWIFPSEMKISHTWTLSLHTVPTLGHQTHNFAFRGDFRLQDWNWFDDICCIVPFTLLTS